MVAADVLGLQSADITHICHEGSSDGCNHGTGYHHDGMWQVFITGCAACRSRRCSQAR